MDTNGRQSGEVTISACAHSRLFASISGFHDSLPRPNRDAPRKRYLIAPAFAGNRRTMKPNERSRLSMNKLLIPSVAALALLCSPAVHGQAVVRETTTTTTTAPLEAAGTVTEWTPTTVIIRKNDVAEPVPFAFSQRVEYVDEAGNPVAREVITRGVPVTVRYPREGDRMLVDRVIVQRRVAPAAVTSTETTTTTTTTVTGHDAKEIEKRREKIARLERELAEHPDRTHLRDDLTDERAKLERLERDIQERR